MVAKIKKENEDAFYNILATLVVNGFNFFAVFFFAKVMGAANFGIYSIYNSWMSLLYPIFSFQVASTLNIVFGKISDEDFYLFSTKVFRLAVLLGGSIVTLFLLFSPIISVWIHFQISLVILLALHAFSFCLIDINFTDLIYKHKAKKRCIIMSFLSISTTLSSIFLTYFWPSQDKYLGRIYGTALPYIFIGTILVTFKLINEKGNISLTIVKFCVLKGAPVIAHTLSHNIMQQSDRIIMELCNVKDEAIGVYSFMYSFCSITNALLSAFLATWVPVYLNGLSKKCADIKVRIRAFIGFFSTILSGFILLSREVCMGLANDEYQKGIEIIPVIVASTAFIFLYQFSVDFEFFKGKTILISILTFSAALFNILANLWLVPIAGYVGAAFTTLLAYGLMFLLHYFVCVFSWKNEFPLSFSLILEGVFPIAFSCLLFYILSSHPLLRWGIGAVLGALELLKIRKRKVLF